MSDVAVLARDAAEPADGMVREDGAKRRQILEGARVVFLADGFDGASMNEIARRAGVSKGTLYVYFSSKEDLFATLIRDEKQAQAEQLCTFEDPSLDPRAALVGFGSRLLDLMLRPESIAHFRIVAAATVKFPRIGMAFYEAGPGFGNARLARFLDRQVEAGLLAIPDTTQAAWQLTELLKGRFLLQAVLGVAEKPGRAEIAAHVTQAVDMFFRAYTPRT